MNPPHIAVRSADPYGRGRERGELLRDALPGGLEIYLDLFRMAGLTEARVRDDALRTADVAGGFRPRLREELEGVAAGAGVELWQVCALNARTEILSQSAAGRPGECSTVVRSLGAGRTVGVQTWDWHMELAPYWHTQEVSGGRHDVAGLTEHGVLGKIGVNSAGLALHFNILGHRADGVGGVPVHLLAATVLEEAGSVEEALDLVRSAKVSASTSFTLFDTGTAVTTDITPVGVFVVEPSGGTLVRTNHFLSAAASAQEKEIYQPDSGERHDLIAARLAAGPAPEGADDLVALLRSGPGEPALCCVPDLDLPLGERWATLATVVLDPAARTARIAPGTPLEARDWRTLTA